MDEPVDRTPLMGYANTWWGISRSALRSMLDIARFELVEERQWSPFDMDVVVRPLDAEPVVPPVDAYRLQRDG
jgi:hypothetical protein